MPNTTATPIPPMTTASLPAYLRPTTAPLLLLCRPGCAGCQRPAR